MEIDVSALGEIKKKYLPNNQRFTITSFTSLEKFLLQNLNIPKTENRICCVVNGKICNKSYLLQDGDRMVVMRMGGAG